MSTAIAVKGALGTLAHFREWTSRLVLDDGEQWRLEPFQVAVIRDVLAGYPEVWMVVPEGNGKTTLMAGVALYHGAHTPNPFVPVGASSREQAEVMYRQAEGFVLRTPGLTSLFKCQEGYRRIKCLETVGRIQVYAADDRTADGVIPSLALLDELHRHRDLRLYRTWRGKIEKRGGQILTISTAGEPGSEFEETRAEIHKRSRKRTGRGQHIRAEAPGIVLHDWAVRERSQCEDMAIVAKANPLRSITAASLAKKRQTPTMTSGHWQRFVCNIASREEGQGISPEAWRACEERGLEPNLSAWCIGWVDLGWQIDTTAMGVLVWEAFDRRVVAGVRILEPPVDENDIAEALLDLQEEFGPEGWVYDPNAGGRQMAQQLDRGEHPRQVGRHAGSLTFIEHPQDNAPMATAAARFDEAVRAGYLRHDGHPGLRAHVLNAVRKQLGGETWRFDRPPRSQGASRARYPIDALTGLLMGHSVAVGQRALKRKSAWHPL
jgi:phage terminase large subunit-like protein